MPIPETDVWLRRILTGHLNYCAVPGNGGSLYSSVYMDTYGMTSFQLMFEQVKIAALHPDLMWSILLLFLMEYAGRGSTFFAH